MKNKIHKFLFSACERENLGHFKVIEDLKKIKPLLSEIELEKEFERNKEFFYKLIIREFTGEIPRTTYEPVLRIFNEQAEDIERWVLWQSYQMRRKVMLNPANPLKIEFYDGVLFFLKVFLEMSHVQRISKTLKPSTQVTENKSTSKSTPQEFVNEFVKGMKDKKGTIEVTEEIK